MTLQSADLVEQVIVPTVRDLGDFDVRRALPSPRRSMVGPFVFVDSFGPAIFRAGSGSDVRPHPHIGLATVSYLFSGETEHRDSEGFVQTVRPGDVAVMTAGRGIVHSERSAAAARAEGHTMFGFQTWLALPLALEETVPTFDFVEADRLPRLEEKGATVQLVAGTFGGARSPARIFSDTLYADVHLLPGARLRIASDHVERAAYIVSGAVAVEGQHGSFERDQLVVFKPGAEIVLLATGEARVMLMGGEPLEGPRHIYWNFVSSRVERIEQAADDWRNGRFAAVPGDPEFIPLPDTPRFKAA